MGGDHDGVGSSDILTLADGDDDPGLVEAARMITAESLQNPTPKKEPCSCPACIALSERYRNDPQLLGFYRKKLLIRGWAGDTDPVEKAYILAHAPWARQITKANARTRFHVSNAGDQTAFSGEVVSEDLETETGFPITGILHVREAVA
jgi:hypothetical protein